MKFKYEIPLSKSSGNDKRKISRTDFFQDISKFDCIFLFQIVTQHNIQFIPYMLENIFKRQMCFLHYKLYIDIRLDLYDLDRFDPYLHLIVEEYFQQIGRWSFQRVIEFGS